MINIASQINNDLSVITVKDLTIYQDSADDISTSRRGYGYIVFSSNDGFASDIAVSLSDPFSSEVSVPVRGVGVNKVAVYSVPVNTGVSYQNGSFVLYSWLDKNNEQQTAYFKAIASGSTTANIPLEKHPEEWEQITELTDATTLRNDLNTALGANQTGLSVDTTETIVNAPIFSLRRREAYIHVLSSSLAFTQNYSVNICNLSTQNVPTNPTPLQFNNQEIVINLKDYGCSDGIYTVTVVDNSNKDNVQTLVIYEFSSLRDVLRELLLENICCHGEHCGRKSKILKLLSNLFILYGLVYSETVTFNQVFDMDSDREHLLLLIDETLKKVLFTLEGCGDHEHLNCHCDGR